MPEKWPNKGKPGDYIDNPGWTVREDKGSTEYGCTECTLTVYGLYALVMRVIDMVGTHPHTGR